MSNYSKHFEMFSDLGSELITQNFVINYIEDTFFHKLAKIRIILGIDLEGDLIFSDNQKTISHLNRLIDEKVNELQGDKIDFIEYPSWLNTIDVRSPIGELIDYISEILNSEQFDSEESMAARIREDITNSHKFLEPKDRVTYTDDEILESIKASKIIKNNKLFYKNTNNVDTLLEFKTTLRLLDNYSLSNIYRQAFINIFSIFDATVFDILKEYSKNNINELENFFR